MEGYIAYACLKIRKMMPPCKGTTFFELCYTALSGYLRYGNCIQDLILGKVLASAKLRKDGLCHTAIGASNQVIMSVILRKQKNNSCVSTRVSYDTRSLSIRQELFFYCKDNTNIYMLQIFNLILG